MPVDATGKYIRIRVRNPDDFVEGSYRVVELSAEQGISSTMGKLKSDPEGSMVIQHYQFTIDKGWTEEKAQKWVEDHKRNNTSKDKESAMYVKADEMERRCLPTAELRIADEGVAPKITGYAAVFNTWADIGGWFRESIKPGAFRKTIKEADVRALWNHDPNYVLARNKSKTLRLWEDDKGLAIEIDPVDSIWANDLVKSMRRGDVDQMSFGFTVNDEDVNTASDERILTDVTLFDVSVVTYPAYPTTSAHVRSLFQKEIREMDMSDMEAVMAKMKKGDKMTPADMEVMKKYMEKMKGMMEEGNSAAIGFSELDRIVGKIKAGETLTEDELRALAVHVPSLSAPAASHAENEPLPAASHEGPDTSKGDRWTDLWIRAEREVPS